MPGSPAEQAGLAKGDIVVSLAGTPIDNLADLSGVLKSHQPGDQVLVEVMRDGARIEHTVTLVERSTR
jgi:S1-C subfamily serine protease